jgi:antitoxin component of RelBE/YafQ-DinJ toxin-antitoxin module
MVKKQTAKLSIDELVKKITTQVIRETLAPLEREQARQAAMADAVKELDQNDSSNGKKNEDLEEAEDEENDDEKKEPAPKAEPEKKSEPKEKVVSSKIATGKEEPKDPKAVIPDPTEIKDVTFNQVVNMMNMMRSGKSSKDPETKQKLGDYFKGLNPGERQALFVLLSGLTQILAGGVAGDEAPDPSAVGIKINPRREEAPTAPSSGVPSPDSAKKASPSKNAPTKSTGPAPIVVGEAADRSDIKKLLIALRK